MSKNEIHRKLIFEHLKNGFEISFVECWHNFKCSRLAARIFDIKQRIEKENLPYQIQSRMVGEGREKFAVYSMIQK